VNPLQVVTCLGLATAAGLNVTLPVLIVGVLAWSGALTLERPFAFLGTGPTLATLSVLAAFEMLADKTLVRRRPLHLLTLPLAIGAAALLSALTLNGSGGVRQGLGFALPLMVSCLVAGGVHVTRTLLRPGAHRMGLGVTILVSWLEDVLAAVLSIGAVLAPLAVLIVFLLSLAGVARFGLWLRALFRRARAWLASMGRLSDMRMFPLRPRPLKDPSDRA
jgi:hypothetical protein